jgi:hypothetical protein
MKKLYGIVRTELNKYCMASLCFNGNKTWSVSKISQWESHNYLKCQSLLNKGVYLGIASWWRPENSEIPHDDIIFAENNADFNNTALYHNNFNVIANTLDFSVHLENLHNNILGVVPEDTYLTTLPLHFYKEPGNNFVTIYGNGDFYTFGITIKRNLIAVFRLAPCDPQKLAGFLQRIEGYWQTSISGASFPSKIITLGDPQYTSDESFTVPAKRIENTFIDEYEMKAAGAALTGIEDNVPFFSRGTPEALFRKGRAIIYGLSVGIIILSIFFSGIVFGLDLWFKNRKIKFENEYQKIIVNNEEIKKLIDRSNELAETIIRLENTFSRQTIWGKFFHSIGEARPKGLFFERFGTAEPAKERKEGVSVAISGWTAEEKNVTVFISKLQDLPYVTQITLSSLERNKKSTYEFNIKCTLLLNE